NIENFSNKVLENFRTQEKIIINSNLNLFSTLIHLDFQALFFDSNNYGIVLKRPGIDVKYIYTLLSSNYLLDGTYVNSDTLNITSISNIEIPFISLEQQKVFARLHDIINECSDLIIRNYFINIRNELVFGLYNDEKFQKYDFSYIFLLEELNLVFQNTEISLIYQNISSGDSLISKYLLIISSIKLLE
uniref:hypothetical protein n=1 Tax=uncultured Chryseobacterium sp. TaxID=259322 RepID=UPI0025EE8061